MRKTRSRRREPLERPGEVKLDPQENDEVTMRAEIGKEGAR